MCKSSQKETQQEPSCCWLLVLDPVNSWLTRNSRILVTPNLGPRNMAPDPEVFVFQPFPAVSLKTCFPSSVPMGSSGKIIQPPR